uniref:CYRIA/CYRIB Rac1 binding domain-containing protein n=1 Tax=Buteo japonicus TaxID=224669 RepID=A0A8C0ANK8_9AVES
MWHVPCHRHGRDSSEARDAGEGGGKDPCRLPWPGRAAWWSQPAPEGWRLGTPGSVQGTCPSFPLTWANRERKARLSDLPGWHGADGAIQNPGDLRLQERAWSAVCPLVAKLKRFYEFSLRLGEHPESPPPYAPTQHLEREQALAKQFAEILHFTLSFDELKMTNPAIQNDFSYYRRTISRNRINNLQLDAESEVNNEMANRMSLFYAEATPMLKTLSNATTKFVSENKTLPIEDTTDCLSTMACVCRVMLETPEYRSRFTNTETLLFCMRVMVGVIILYDHVHPVGAFAKTSKIDMKGCIKVLKDQPSTSTEGLLNALRYTTRHLNDDTTSKQIRALLQ